MRTQGERGALVRCQKKQYGTLSPSAIHVKRGTMTVAYLEPVCKVLRQYVRRLPDHLLHDALVRVRHLRKQSAGRQEAQRARKQALVRKRQGSAKALGPRGHKGEDGGRDNGRRTRGSWPQYTHLASSFLRSPILHLEGSQREHLRVQTVTWRDPTHGTGTQEPEHLGL